MTLVEEYYELNEAEEVPVIWKIMQIGFYGAAAGLGLWCGFTIGVLRVKLGDRCFLFTKVHESKNETIHFNDVDWESDIWCDYCQFTLVSSFIVGIIWAAFYLMCGKGGKSVTGLPQPWRIVWPSLIFNFIYFMIALSSSVSIQKGTDCFCRFNVTFDRHFVSCTGIEVLLEEKDRDLALFQIHAVPKTSWGCTISWLILFLLSFVRIFFLIDFRLYKICVFKIDDTIQDKREEVLKITNYEEQPKISTDNTHRITYEDSEKKESLQNVESRRGILRMSNNQFQPNTAIYEATDRGMSRENRSRNPTDRLDEDFEKHLNAERRRAFAAQDRSGASEIRSFFRQTTSVYEDDADLNSSTIVQRLSYKQDFDPKHSLTFKKLI